MVLFILIYSYYEFQKISLHCTQLRYIFYSGKKPLKKKNADIKLKGNVQPYVKTFVANYRRFFVKVNSYYKLNVHLHLGYSTHTRTQVHPPPQPHIHTRSIKGRGVSQSTL